MNPHVFREYDVRGLVDSELTPAFARTLGAAFATYGAERGMKAIALGRDCRESSTALRDAFAEGLTRAGASAIDIGVVPTPLTYFAAHTLPVDGLCMITGSHNPPEYNGFKLGVGRATLHGGEIQALRRVMEAGRFHQGNGALTSQPIIESYTKYVSQNLRLGPRRPRLVIDAGNGTGGFVAAPLFEGLGFPVTRLYCEMDGRFPNHHPDPTVPKNLEPLIAEVRRSGADCGIAYDGDADRVGAVDEQGNILWGDQLMLLFARDILREQPGATFVSEVKCSMTLYDEIEKRGGKAVMWKAGHSLIKAKMKETGALLAGEMSGHIFFAHRWFGFDDGIYSSARLAELLSRTEEPLSRLLADVPRTFASPEIRADFPEEKKFEAVERAKKYFRERNFKTVEVDGVRVVFPDGWGLVRASNTQPLLVLRFEATTAARMAEIRALVEGALAEVRREISA